MTNKDASRFWIKVDTSKGESACWIWKAGRFPKGYGAFQVNGKCRRAHVVAYELAIAKVPDGLCVLHSCDNPPCCNPSHLTLGTNEDNCRDRHHKGRDAKGKSHGRATKPDRTARGERCRMSKLTSKDVPVIRKMRKLGSSQSDIAAVFGVTQAAISSILTGRTWKHIK